MEMQVIYSIEKDPTFLENSFSGNIETNESGISPKLGLVGSDKWWNNIKSGAIPTITALGKLTQVYMGSMNDWPMFEMTTDDGINHKWTRELNPSVADSLYKEGIPLSL